MGRERLETAIAWIAWVRGVLEAEFSQLAAVVASQIVAPFDGSVAQCLGAALAMRGEHGAASERLNELLAVLAEVERQIAIALAETDGEAR